jgi:hypothetical protein
LIVNGPIKIDLRRLAQLQMIAVEASQIMTHDVSLRIRREFPSRSLKPWQLGSFSVR